MLSNMLKEKCTNCVMEVSSHSLALSRVDELDFNVGVFTNITSDHLDFHSTFENYLNTKKIFFDNLKSSAFLVFNKDDINFQYLIKDSSASRISYSIKNKSDLTLNNIDYNLDGTKYQLSYLGKIYEVKTKLIGQFNAYNSTAAIGASIYSGVGIEKAIEGIYSSPDYVLYLQGKGGIFVIRVFFWTPHSKNFAEEKYLFIM